MAIAVELAALLMVTVYCADGGVWSVLPPIEACSANDDYDDDDGWMVEVGGGGVW